MANTNPDDCEKVHVMRPVAAAIPISAEFGRYNPKYWNPFHKGTDFACPVETPVYAVMDGKVQITGFEQRLGNRVWIVSKHLDGRLLRHGYGHLMGCVVELNAEVKKGQLIGLSGATGRRIDGSNVPPHMHFQIELWPSRELLSPEFVGQPDGF